MHDNFKKEKPVKLFTEETANESKENQPIKTRPKSLIDSKSCMTVSKVSNKNESTDDKEDQKQKIVNNPLPSCTDLIPFGYDVAQKIRNIPITSTKWPKKVTSRSNRQFLEFDHNALKCGVGSGKFKKEATNHCIFCKNVESDSEIISCGGYFSGMLKKGKKIKCRSVFHLNCVLNYNASDYNIQYILLPECQNEILCPLHFCDTCFFERKKQTAFQGKLIECALCLRSFHYERCAPIGSKDLEMKLEVRENEVHNVEMVICPSHRPSKEIKMSSHMPICCECEKEDNSIPLVKCRICIRSFHATCRLTETVDNEPVVPDLCEFCLTGECVRYDMPVVGRWSDNKFYPAYTRDWSKCPNKLRKNQNYDQLGYVTIEWQEGSTVSYSICSIADCVPIFESSLQVLGKKANTQTANIWQSLIERSGNLVHTEPLLKEVRRKIETSKYLHKDYEKCGPLIEPEKYICDCPANSENRCSTDKCSNLREYYECPPECNEKGKCHNRGVSEKITNPKVVRKATTNKGFGVFATELIRKGEFIAEYAGEIINRKEIEKRNLMISQARDDEANLYMMSLTQGRAVDAARAGNIARYINHSCDPNCQTIKRTVFVKVKKNEVIYDYRIAIVAIKDIEEGEELSFTYQMDDVVNTAPPKCKCGSKNCAGSLGGGAKNDQKEIETVNEIPTNKKTKKVLAVTKKRKRNTGNQNSVSNRKKAKIESKQKSQKIRMKEKTPIGLIEIADDDDHESVVVVLKEMLGKCCKMNDCINKNALESMWKMTEDVHSTSAWLFGKVYQRVSLKNEPFISPIMDEINKSFQRNAQSSRRSNSSCEENTKMLALEGIPKIEEIDVSSKLEENDGDTSGTRRSGRLSITAPVNYFPSNRKTPNKTPSKK